MYHSTFALCLRSGKWLDWPGENVNLVNYTEHASVVEALHAQLLDYIQIK